MRTGFRHSDLLAWVRQHRGEILAAVFTLGRAWITAGRPGPIDGTPVLGGFEGWRHSIGGLLRVTGVQGFLANLAQLYDVADDDTPAWAAFLASWRACYGDRAVAVAELLEDVRERPGDRGRLPSKRPELRTALPAELAEAIDKPSATKRVGHALKRKAETRYVVDDDGMTLRLVREPDLHANAMRWRVLR
jgi:hypothetical protein